VLFVDALIVKIKDGTVANRPVYRRSGCRWTASGTC
jgi:transposase-like protein